MKFLLIICIFIAALFNPLQLAIAQDFCCCEYQVPYYVPCEDYFVPYYAAPCEDYLCPPQHCFYIGPEFYHMNRIKKGGTKQDGWLYGVRGGYDRIKRYRLYWGIEGYWAQGDLHGKNSNKDRLTSTVTDSEIEGRIGYTFGRKTLFRAWFTPFVGAGYFRETNNFKKPSPLHLHFRDEFSYVVGGFISRLCITQELSIGITFKYKYPWDSKSRVSNDPEFENSELMIANKSQYSVDVPIRYLFCWCERILDISLVPFYQYRHFGGHENYPFDFIDTKFRIYGGRLLLNFCF